MQKNDQVAIKVIDVHKSFKLPHLKKSSVKHVFTSLFDRSKNPTEIQHALNGISFEIKSGEFFGIVGRNGSGKSTMLKILAEIYRPTTGSVHVDGKLVPFIELGVGFNPELSGRENVYLNGALLGFTKQQIDQQYDDIVEFAELGEFMDQKLKNYSSGMQVRLAFSVATRADADILLVDEVLAVGDADFQRKCYEFFGELKKKKKTVVFVTHDMNAVREYCDRAILIEKSKLLSAGTASEVATEYTKLFLNKGEVDASEQKKDRWGEGGVTFEKVSISPTRLTTEQEVRLTMTVSAARRIENPVIGFSIKSATGEALTGMNNQIKRQAIKIMQPNETRTLEWVMPNIFGDGKFYIDVAAASAGGKVYEWWEDAVSFRCRREERTPYFVQPNIELTITGN